MLTKHFFLPVEKKAGPEQGRDIFHEVDSATEDVLVHNHSPAQEISTGSSPQLLQEANELDQEPIFGQYMGKQVPPASRLEEPIILCYFLLMFFLLFPPVYCLLNKTDQFQRRLMYQAGENGGFYTRFEFVEGRSNV